MFLKKIACGLLCAAMLLAAGCGGVGTQTGGDKAYLQLTDAAGRQVSLAKKPERVVSLSPSYLSMIEAVGGTVVGRALGKQPFFGGHFERIHADLTEIAAGYHFLADICAGIG